MHSVVAYIKEIRLKQVKRELSALGLIYSLVIAAVLFFAIKATVVSVTTFRSQLIFSLIWSALLPTIHFSRKDIRFLEITKKSTFKFLFTDYFLLSLIPICILCYCGGFLAAGVLLIIAIAVCFIPVSQKSRKSALAESNFIPNYLIEWKSGIRKSNKYFFLVLYILGLTLSFLPFFSLFACWIITGIICGFYQSFEPRNQLRFHHSEPKNYLNYKIKIAAISYLKIIAPLMFIYLLFHPDQWIIILTALFLFLCILVFTLVAKYAYYSPGETSGPHQIYFTIGLLSLFIPFMVPIPLVLTMTHYRKAIKRLTPYFYGSN
jgi:hypothetical protein